MANLKIEATEYTRQDGLKMIRLPTGNWVIRKGYGPTWFYSTLQSKWIISTVIPDLAEVGIPFDRASELLNQLPELS